MEDLVAVWKMAQSQRFQNYRASFTVLDVPCVRRAWLNDIIAGNPLSSNCPNAWKKWVKSGSYRALKAERSAEHRSKQEQIPNEKTALKIIHIIHEYFKQRPVDFEACAAKIAQMVDYLFI